MHFHRIDAQHSGGEFHGLGHYRGGVSPKFPFHIEVLGGVGRGAIAGEVGDTVDILLRRLDHDVHLHTPPVRLGIRHRAIPHGVDRVHRHTVQQLRTAGDIFAGDAAKGDIQGRGG